MILYKRRPSYRKASLYVLKEIKAMGFLAEDINLAITGFYCEKVAERCSETLNKM